MICLLTAFLSGFASRQGREVKETHNHVRKHNVGRLMQFFFNLSALIYDLKSCSKVQDDIKNACGVYWQAGETRRCQKISVNLSIWRMIIKSGCQFLLTDIGETNSTKLSIGIKGCGGCWEVNGGLCCSRRYHRRKKLLNGTWKKRRFCCTMLNLFKKKKILFSSQLLLLWSVSSIESKVSDSLSINMHNNRFNTKLPRDKIKASRYFLLLLRLCFSFHAAGDGGRPPYQANEIFLFSNIASWSHADDGATI